MSYGKKVRRQVKSILVSLRVASIHRPSVLTDKY